jgi:hypothetical protein
MDFLRKKLIEYIPQKPKKNQEYLLAQALFALIISILALIEKYYAGGEQNRLHRYWQKKII